MEEETGVRQLYSGRRGSRTGKKRRITAGITAFLVGMVLFCPLFSIQKNSIKEEGSFWIKTAEWLQERAGRMCMPVFSFVEEETGIKPEPFQLIKDFFRSGLPLLAYGSEREAERISIEDRETRELLIWQEGSDEERKGVAEGSLEYDENALHIHGDLHQAMEEENNRHSKKPEETVENAEQKSSEQENAEQETTEQETTQQETAEENGDFQKALAKRYEYNWAELEEYDDIVSAFYAIDSTTSITNERLNLENLLGKDMRMQASKEDYQILIYHTHSQEDFVDSVEGDSSTTIIGAGEKLARLLEETYGYRVLHHKGEYDVESRDYAYSNSLPAIEQILAENPNIQVVIDLHRDAMPEGKKLVVELDGRPTAQFMFFNGLSRTRENGDISYLENQYIDENLAFSFQAQIACNEYYPGLARRIYLKAYRYNMHLKAQCMLVELGAQTNTVEEIMNACDPLAHVIAKVLSGETGDQARMAAGIELDNEG